MTTVRLKIDEALTADRAARRDAGRGDGLQGCRLGTDPAGRRHKTNNSRSDDFPAGSLGCKGGGGEPPLHVHGYLRFREMMSMR
ncbi:hypothetical protein H262_10256 [Citrobacter freundii GTC 09479]|nr:hypothetical protein H262_10256 [Citrobacter freundii GTC 09479]